MLQKGRAGGKGKAGSLAPRSRQRPSQDKFCALGRVAHTAHFSQSHICSPKGLCPNDYQRAWVGEVCENSWRKAICTGNVGLCHHFHSCR